MNPLRGWTASIGIFAAGACAAIYVVLRAKWVSGWGVGLFGHGAFFVIFALMAAWAWTLARAARARGFSVRRFLRANRSGLLLAAAVTAIAFASVPVGFKTLSDETNLLSVSQSMFAEKKAWNATMGKSYYGGFNPIFVEVPTRPLVFPFAISLVHTVLGYQARNAFILNGLLLFSLFSLVYALTRPRAGGAAGSAAVLLIAAQPIVTISGTSGGFDLMSALFCAVVIAVFVDYLRRPTGEMLALLWISLVVFSNIRYESIVFIPIIGLAILSAGTWRKEHLFESRWVIALTPFFFLPFLLQRVLTHGKWENAPGTEPFSIGNLWKHLKILVSGQVDFRFLLPYATLVNLVAFCILGTLAVLAARGLRRPGKDRGANAGTRIIMPATLLVLFVVSTSIFLAHHMGDYSHPTQARFFLVFSIICSLMPIVFKVLHPTLVPTGTLLAAAVGAFVLYHPVAVDHRFIQMLTLNRETQACMKLLESRGTFNLLVIADRPGQYASLGYGAVDFGRAEADHAILLAEQDRRLYAEVLVFQKIDYRTGEAVPSNRLRAEFRLETLEETQIDSGLMLRISRVLPRSPNQR